MFRIKTVYAHCDVPCGVYETDTMGNAAYTCLKMIDKAEELGDVSSNDQHNNFIRIVMTKEKHAETVKRQLSILWGDYFKPEHLEKYPDLHDRIWKTAKQASKVKQTMSREEAQKLVTMVTDVEQLFADSKK